MKRTSLLPSQKAYITISILLIAIGIASFKSFGITYDEPAMRNHGIATAIQLQKTFFDKSNFLEFSDPRMKLFKSPELDNPDARSHPVIFELLLVATEFSLKLTDNKSRLWKIRHLVTFAINCLGILILFALIYQRFHKYSFSFLGAAIFISSPRIFSDLFYNNKDMFFLTAYIVSSYFAMRYLFKPSLKTGTLAGIFIGLAMSLRIAGIFVLLTTLVVLLFFQSSNSFRSKISSFSAIVVTAFISLILFMPYFWNETLQRLLEYFSRSLNFNWIGDVFFAGRIAPSNDLPWNYIPLWISVTTPIYVLLFFIIGIIHISKISLKFNLRFEKSESTKETYLQDIFFSFLLFMPLLVGILTNVTIYNGWRHFYFLYPFIVYFALLGFSSFLEFLPKLKKISWTFVFLSILFYSIWIQAYLPLSSLYFNSLAGREVSRHWEVDYWAVANREILETISTLKEDEITIYDINNSPLYDSKIFLDISDQRRIHLLRHSESPASADFFVSRNELCLNQLEYCEFRGLYRLKPIIKRKVGNTHVYTIYENRK